MEKDVERIDRTLVTYFDKNDAYHVLKDKEQEVRDIQQVKYEKKIDDIHRALYGDKENGEEGIIETTKFIKDLKGFWRVVGFFAGVLGLGVAMVSSIAYFVGNNKP